MKKSIDELLQDPYWIIDILPKQVPRYSSGQYFKVEKYFLAEPRLSEQKQKHINIILKLNCYRDISLDEDGELNPDPEIIDLTMRERYVCIMVDDAMIISEPDDTHMTLFNPDEKLVELVKELAKKEGMYVWEGMTNN